MSKGFADYLIVSAMELDRGLAREIYGVEVPLFKSKFENWLKKQSELSLASQRNYMRWLGKADSWVLDTTMDFWILLKKDWELSDFTEAKHRCQDYEDILIKDKGEAAINPEVGESSKEIGNWISAFRKYRQFLEETMENADIEKRAQSALIEASRETAKNLFLADLFLRWGESQGKSADTMESYVSNIKRVNRDLFCKTGYDLLHDFLVAYFKAKNMARIEEMFSAMDRKLTERIDDYDESEMSREAFQNSRSALRLYADFIKDMIRIESEKSESGTLDNAGPADMETDGIYKIEEFSDWLITEKVLSENTASAYKSYLKKLDREMKIEENGIGVMDYVSWLISKDDGAAAFEVLDKADENLTKIYSSVSTSEQRKKAVSDQRSALRRYIEFLHEEVDDVPDEEELEDAASSVPALAGKDETFDAKEETILYEYPIEELRKNFAFRLNTQNRMSQDKEVFYPISIIKKLLCYSQRKGKKEGNPNTDHNWLKDWNYDYVGEIKVLTEKGSHTLSEISALLISPVSGRVYSRKSEGRGDVLVYTEKVDGGKEPMKANSLRGIHIDHTPLMADVLKDNATSLPALNALSKEIKAVARSKRVDITTRNFGKISKLLFASPEFVDTTLLPLIPALKEELDFLRKKSSLTLMGAAYNLRKK